MPRIFDNIDQSLLTAIRETLAQADHADFCVGYFNLRGWKQIDEMVERWSGGLGQCCRLLVGMQRLPQKELGDALSILKPDHPIDNQTAIRKKRELANEFRDQLVVGLPTNQDEVGLRRLAAQIRAKKIVVKLYLRHPLHAKLYLLFRPDPVTPTIGFVGSSNLTFAGLSQQGELNLDVVEQDACAKLAKWFEERWEDHWCLDISKELLEIIDESWAHEELLPPYHICKRFRVIRDYIERNESKVVLLSATPYNKSYLDLASQLRLFLAEDRDIGIRPEALLREIGENEFRRRFQCAVRTLAGFEKSLYADDWRELMRLYLVRRTRSFIQDNYAQTDQETGRKYLTFPDGSQSFFPTRRPRTVKFKIDDKNAADQYALLYSAPTVDAINRLALPRYGLGNYLEERPHDPPTPAEARIILDLSRAGKRLMGFCRTNLFKRLESSGQAFMLSIERHILRNHVYLHAIEAGLPLPIGTQDASLLDARFTDAERDLYSDDEEENDDHSDEDIESVDLGMEAQFRRRAADVYRQYAGPWKKRFRWLASTRFLGISDEDLAQRVVDLREEGRLCIIHEEEESQEPRIICSLGLRLH